MKHEFDMLEPRTTAEQLTTPNLLHASQASKKQRVLLKPMLDERKVVHQLLLHVEGGEHDSVRSMLRNDINWGMTIIRMK